MKPRFRQDVIAAALAGVLMFIAGVARAADPLPSWNDGPAKQSILAFVAKVTTPGSPDYVSAAERIATFDNDGTLWCEKPVPVQLYFLLDRVNSLAPGHPEWKTEEPFASILEGDMKNELAGGEPALLQLFAATHAGMTTDEFAEIVKNWIATAKNPATGRRFVDMTYQPMLEVLAYLRANDFKIVRGLGRRHRVHAAVGRRGLRHPAGACRGFELEDEVRAA